jgi:phage repressor protein C with HTH and peptisase S24 domain
MNVWESIDYVSQWAKDKREALGLSQEEVADAASRLWKAAGGKALQYQSIQQLEMKKHKGVPVWFPFVRQAIEEAHEAAKPKRSEEAPARKVSPEPDFPPAVADDVEMIREVDMRFAMGNGSHLEDFPETGQMPFNRNMRRALTSSPADALFVARGDGDSMQPTLINDDAVLIDTAQNRINQSDRIWALRIEDAGLIKRVRVLPKVGYELISDNPNIKPQVVAREDVHVVGRVIWVGRRV